MEMKAVSVIVLVIATIILIILAKKNVDAADKVENTDIRVCNRKNNKALVQCFAAVFCLVFAAAIIFY